MPAQAFNSYPVGTTVRFSTIFDDGATPPVDTDPTTITLVLRDPNFAKSTFTFAAAQLTKTAVGRYRRDEQLNVEGWWEVRWEGTGVLEAVATSRVYVHLSNV